MSSIIILTPDELEGIIKRCLSSFVPMDIQEQKQQTEGTKYLHSIKDLAEFLNCSVVTAQKLKNSGKIRFKQYGRKVIFSTAEVLEDINKSERRKR